VTDTAFEILDELYFVTSYSELATRSGLPEETLCKELDVLITKGLVKCFYPDPDTEITFEAAGFAEACRNYFYLATKAGLLAHNSR
jgi:DNA-binding IclR family transcriptional regulator